MLIIPTLNSSLAWRVIRADIYSTHRFRNKRKDKKQSAIEIIECFPNIISVTDTRGDDFRDNHLSRNIIRLIKIT